MDILKRPKEKMSKRERVEATFKNQKTDRTPVYDLLLHDGVIEYFSGKFPPTGEEGMKLKCVATREMLDMTRGAGSGPTVPGVYDFHNGLIFLPGIKASHSRNQLLGFVEKSFHDEDTAISWLNGVNNILRKTIKDFDSKKYGEQYRERFISVQNHIGDDTVQLHRETLTGIDYIRAPLGLDLFSYIWVDEPGVLVEYFDLCDDLEIMICHSIADKKLSPCVLTAGDIAFKHSLLHSPQWLREQFFPRLKKLNAAWHEHDIKCLFHSDGNLMPVMDDLIETGIDGLNPIETNAGMDVGVLKKMYGDRIFLTGGIDMSTLLSFGNPDEVRQVCEKAIEEAPTGYFIGSTTELDNSAKLENILAMLEVAWRAK